jgi:hypothetical protein
MDGAKLGDLIACTETEGAKLGECESGAFGDGAVLASLGPVDQVASLAELDGE